MIGYLRHARCKALGCDHAIPAGALFCRSHWGMLSEEIRRRIAGARGNIRRALKENRDAMWQTYRDLVAEAMRLITERERADRARREAA